MILDDDAHSQKERLTVTYLYSVKKVGISSKQTIHQIKTKIDNYSPSVSRISVVIDVLLLESIKIQSSMDVSQTSLEQSPGGNRLFCNFLFLKQVDMVTSLDNTI